MKLKSTYETEVYISDGGYLAIAQPDPMGGEAQIVLLSPEQARLVARKLEEAASDDGWWQAGEE